MPNASLTNIMPWLDMLSDGVSSQNYVTHSGHTPSKEMAQNRQVARTPSGAVLEWTSTSLDGNFKYTTSVTVGDLGTQYQQADIYRAACLYLVCHLDNKSIVEAYDSLRGVYLWQQQEAQHYLPKVPVRGVLTISSMPHIERTPFVVDDEP
jgi:predicted phage gp36 major capsid-like protein